MPYLNTHAKPVQARYALLFFTLRYAENILEIFARGRETYTVVQKVEYV